jgi:hypothetical protein
MQYDPVQCGATIRVREVRGRSSPICAKRAILAAVALAALVGGAGSDLINARFWRRHALLARAGRPSKF